MKESSKSDNECRVIQIERFDLNGKRGTLYNISKKITLVSEDCHDVYLV
jgi:hypothetical protein